MMSDDVVAEVGTVVVVFGEFCDDDSTNLVEPRKNYFDVLRLF